MALKMRNPTTAESTYPFPRYYGKPIWLERLRPQRVQQITRSSRRGARRRPPRSGRNPR